MHPLSIVAFLFWAGTIASILCFLIDRQLHGILKQNWKMVLGTLILVAAWRLPLEGRFFHGLEYEDSYVYTVAGRQIAEHVGPTIPTGDTPFSLSTCAAGSLANCQSWEPAPEHLIGYPYVISLASLVLGYTPGIGTTVNFISAFIVAILIFCIVRVSTSSLFAAGAAAIIFAATPVFAVYGLETSAEPLLNVSMSLCLWFYLRFTGINDEGARWNRWVYWSGFTLLLLFSLVIKREGVVLVLVLVVVSPFVLKQIVPTHNLRRKLFALIVASAILCLVMGIGIKLAKTTISEASLFASYPPTLSSAGLLAFAYLRSFLIYQCYLGVAVIAAIGAVACVRRRGFALIPLTFTVAYIALYAFHIRGFYEMRSPNMDPWAGLRFSMSFMSCFAILGGMGLSSLWEKLRTARLFRARPQIVTAICCTAVLACLIESFVETTSLREDAIADERQTRFNPAFAALDHATHGGCDADYFATFEPLILQMYGSPSVKVIDLHAATAQSLELLNSSSDTSNWVLIDDEEDHTDANEVRYSLQLLYLRSLPWTELQAAETFRLLRFKRR
jgi:hypothetical protein